VRYLRRNVVLVYGVYAVTFVSGLVATPIIIGALGNEGYGLWAFVNAVVAFLVLLDLGLTPTVIRFAAADRGRGTTDETSRVASTALAIYAALALVATGVGLVLTALLPALIDVDESLVSAGRIAFVLALAGVVVRFPLGVATSLLAAQQRYDVINLAGLVSAVVYLALVVVVFLAWDAGLVALAAIAFATTLLRLALPLLWLRRELPTLRIRRELATRAGARELLGFSRPNFLINVASKVVLSTDVIVVGVVLGSVAAGLYALPAKLFALALGIGVAAATLVFPVLAELEGAEDPVRQRRYVLSGVRIGLGVVLLAAAPLALLPDAFLAGWLGDEYRAGGFDRSVPVLVLLMVSIVFVQPATMLTQYLIARGRHAPLAVARVVTVTVNLALTIVLAATVGIWAVAAATVATEAVSTAVVMPLLVRRASGSAIGFRDLALAWLRPIALAAGAALPTLVVLGRLVDSHRLGVFVAVGACWALAFGAVMWRYGLEPDERETLANALLRLRPAPAAVARATPEDTG
jgi:O-antigen/teichoic acid export membrane protein